MSIESSPAGNLLSVVDVVEKFRVHPNTLRLWRTRGKKGVDPLPAIKKGERYFYLEEDIIKFKQAS